jgi:GNAT superfamily N-acetyltransferase
VVDADHRRRGLARWLKGAMVLQLDDATKHVETDNAASNASMLAINTEMGFKPWITVEIYQIAAVTLAAWAQRA